MPKCLYCLKQNEEYFEECRFCHKPMRASNAKPGAVPAKRIPSPPVQRPMPPTGYGAGGQMQGYSQPENFQSPNTGQYLPQYQQPYQAQPAYQAAQQVHGASCPLCNRADGMWERNKLLYDVPVCSKCSSDFTNRRVLAFIIDKIAWLFFPGFFLGVLSPFLPRGIVILMALFVTAFGFLFRDGFQGKSIGKRVMGLMVVDSYNGMPIGFSQSIRRNLIFYVPFLPFIAALSLSKGARLGDGWAHTKVVWAKYLGYGPFADIQPVTAQTNQSQAYSSRLGQI